MHKTAHEGQGEVELRVVWSGQAAGEQAAAKPFRALLLLKSEAVVDEMTNNHTACQFTACIIVNLPAVQTQTPHKGYIQPSIHRTVL